MAPRATLRQVAERAGVSPAAVSRAFAGGPISARLRDRVLEAADALGYVPNLLARSLTTGRTGLVALVADNFANPAFLEVFDRFTRRLQAEGLRPLLVNLSGQPEPAWAARLLGHYAVDGVLVASSTLPEALIGALAAAGRPLVHAFGPAAGAAVPVASVDNRAAGALAARTLAARGHRSVGVLAGPPEASSTRDRLAGFREAAAGAGLAVEVRVAGAYRQDAGRAAMAEALREGSAADGWFCGDDLLAIGALDALDAAGRAVPGDVALLGMNDIPEAAWGRIALSTIRQPIPALIEAAVAMLLARIEDPSLPPETRLLPCTLIERATLRPAP